MKLSDSDLRKIRDANVGETFDMAIEILQAREVVAATEKLLARPEVKMAAAMAPALKPDIDRLKKALAEYNK
jgi:hypothetical protein